MSTGFPVHSLFAHCLQPPFTQLMIHPLTLWFMTPTKTTTWHLRLIQNMWILCWMLEAATVKQLPHLSLCCFTFTTGTETWGINILMWQHKKKFVCECKQLELRRQFLDMNILYCYCHYKAVCLILDVLSTFLALASSSDQSVKYWHILIRCCLILITVKCKKCSAWAGAPHALMLYPR